MTISQDRLMEVLIRGRNECYVKKSSDYNPYEKSDIYDWKFRLETDDLIFTDSYRGINPYSGVEYVYKKGESLPVWSCDYVGYSVQNTGIFINRIYEFLKEARGAHLMNCGGNLFSDFQYECDVLQYKTEFHGDADALLQIERIYFNNELAAEQVTAGRLHQLPAKW